MLVPRIIAEATVLSSLTMVPCATAIGAAALTSSILLIESTSDRARLLFSKEFEEVSSSMMVVTESLVVLGRTTIRSEPMSETSLLMRFAMLPVNDKIKIILAMPIAIPKQVRKERVRFSLIEVVASLK